MIIEKFYRQRPLNRTRQLLADEGMDVSLGTLVDGLHRIGGLLQPLYGEIIRRNQASGRWQMDETRWRVFEQAEGKKTFRWWLWAVLSPDTVVYLLDPSRSRAVPRKHLGPDPEGTLTADRCSVYPGVGGKIQVSHC